jgi:hypothetical protein
MKHQQQFDHESYGVLVGWTHSEFTGRIDLKLQAIQSTRADSPTEPDSHHFMMTPNQAGLLADYLFKITQRRPPRKRSWLARWFGS